MNRKRLISFVKKFTISMLTVGMIVAGIVICPKSAEAEDTTNDKVIYEKYTSEQVASYWNTDGKTAPVKAGYVFGGWFNQVTDDAEKTDKTETYTKNGTDTYYNPLTTVSGEAYAKFVPASVLSVKAQNEGKVTEDFISKLKVDANGIVTDPDNKFYVRVLTSVDSANYQKVGFEIELGNWIPVYKDGTTDGATESNKIYRGLMVNDESKTANQIFGGESEYLSVWQLSQIDCPGNVSLIIYVRPYWVTMDGTKVEGLAKYVHIEDQYEGYVSVPVNILNKDVAAKLAAGRVDMTYENAMVHEFEAGRMLPNMKKDQSDGIIKMVGYGTANEYNATETLFANIRFKDITTDVDFTMNMVNFSDWSENPFTINEKWDVKYDVQETINE